MNNETAGTPDNGASHDNGQADEHILDEENAASSLPVTDSDPALPHEAKDMIGQQLRKIYGDMVAEPLPDRFNDLLSKLSLSEPRS